MIVKISHQGRGRGKEYSHTSRRETEAIMAYTCWLFRLSSSCVVWPMVRVRLSTVYKILFLPLLLWYIFYKSSVYVPGRIPRHLCKTEPRHLRIPSLSIVPPHSQVRQRCLHVQLSHSS